MWRSAVSQGWAEPGPRDRGPSRAAGWLQRVTREQQLGAVVEATPTQRRVPGFVAVAPVESDGLDSQQARARGLYARGRLDDGLSPVEVVGVGRRGISNLESGHGERDEHGGRGLRADRIDICAGEYQGVDVRGRQTVVAEVTRGGRGQNPRPLVERSLESAGMGMKSCAAWGNRLANSSTSPAPSTRPAKAAPT